MLMIFLGELFSVCSEFIRFFFINFCLIALPTINRTLYAKFLLELKCLNTIFWWFGLVIFCLLKNETDEP